MVMRQMAGTEYDIRQKFSIIIFFLFSYFKIRFA